MILHLMSLTLNKSVTKICGGVSALQVQVIRGGNKKVLNKLMGAVQKESKGRADPVQLRNMLEEMTS